jgi:hypothetical protein
MAEKLILHPQKEVVFFQFLKLISTLTNFLIFIAFFRYTQNGGFMPNYYILGKFSF